MGKKFPIAKHMRNFKGERMKIILLGAPGSGKGTLAKNIVKDFSLAHISTGDMFRECVKSGSKLGNKLKSIMDSGALVPDEVTIEIVKDRLSKDDCKRGFILDGFPRTIKQAEALEKISQIDTVILVDLSKEEIIERLSARRTCLKCGSTFNKNDVPDGKCLNCKSELIQRDDDKPLTISNRLEVYEKNTAPLINFYSDRLVKFSSAGTPEETYKPVKAFLKKMEAKVE